MSTAATTAEPSGAGAYLRSRIGSFLAFFPLSIWVILHLWHNLAAFRGAAAWQHEVTEYTSPVAELATAIVVLLPLLLHTAWGISRLTSTRPNLGGYRFYGNLKYTLQRLSALGVLLFLGAHVWLAYLNPHLLEGHAEPFQDLAHEMRFNGPTLPVYLLGTLGVAYHLANGLNSFAMGWGLASSKKGLMRLDRLALVLFFVLLSMSWGAIFALWSAGGSLPEGAPMDRRRPLLAALALFVSLAACTHLQATPPRSPLEQARAQAGSSDSEEVGRWMLSELTLPKGSVTRAEEARKRLLSLPHKGLWASLALALEAEAHGEFHDATLSFVATLHAAHDSLTPRTPLLAWVAAHRLLMLLEINRDLWTLVKADVEHLVDSPGQLGWRARGDLAQAILESMAHQEPKALPARATALYGCIQSARLAGPFGHQVPEDLTRPFPAEEPAPWPQTWPHDPQRVDNPRQRPLEASGCSLHPTESIPAGVYFLQTFLDVSSEQELIISVQGAMDLRVDDVSVLQRSPREWGSWIHFGAHVRLQPGRHRILARVVNTNTSIRLLAPDGLAAHVSASADDTQTYSLTPPRVVADPNWLDRYFHKGQFLEPSDPLEAFLAAQVASFEGQNDLADVLLGPHVADPKTAAPLALQSAGRFIEEDPIFPSQKAHDLARTFHELAIAADPKQVFSRLWLQTDKASTGATRMSQSIQSLRELVDEFPEVLPVGRILVQALDKLGYRVERDDAILALVKRFPDEPQELQEAIDVLRSRGAHKQADALQAHLTQVEPQSDSAVDLALSKHDYSKAEALLEKLQSLETKKDAFKTRIAKVHAQAGQPVDWVDIYRHEIALDPLNASARLSLADVNISLGKKGVLTKAISSAISAGADATSLRSAAELIAGATELEPYRIDGAAVIRDYDAVHGHMEGTAARILDYSALWIHSDGTARMLEHEIIRVQSQEAIRQFAEQQPPQGALILRLRVHKADGRILEPEPVEGKPTVTMPHLDVGDTLETEYVFPTDSDGNGGVRYLSPTWSFREANVGYWRSEFVVISPQDRQLQIETRGKVPAPVLSTREGLTVRDWRVNYSEPAHPEPDGPPLEEYLPSVRVGWGISLADQLQRIYDASYDDLPLDPRVTRMASEITLPVENLGPIAKAQRLYRWVVDNIADGKETDARHVILGMSGQRGVAFRYLCRAAAVPLKLAAVKDALTPSDLGPIQAATAYDDIAFVVDPGKPDQRWLTVSDRHAPFGYLPAELREQDAVLLISGLPHVRAESSVQVVDGVSYDGEAKIHEDGSATLDLRQHFLGKEGIELRDALEQIPEASLHNVIETKLLSRILPSARLDELTIEDRDNPDAPLTLHMKLEASTFAQSDGGTLRLRPPLMTHLSPLVELVSRQTPLVLTTATYSEVNLTLRFPSSYKVDTRLDDRSTHEPFGSVDIHDRAEGSTLTLSRKLSLPAERIAPSEYDAFRTFALGVDDSLRRDVDAHRAR